MRVLHTCYPYILKYVFNLSCDTYDLILNQIALKFADLHDTPGRMHAKGCITDTVAWRGSRKFFYWRLKRRIMEEVLGDSTIFVY